MLGTMRLGAESYGFYDDRFGPGGWWRRWESEHLIVAEKGHGARTGTG
jgi:hypothetical protein